MVHGEKELVEKLGRNDLCPCGTGRRFQKMLHARRPVRWFFAQLLFSIEKGAPSGALESFISRYGRASNTILNGVSAARRTLVNPAVLNILVKFASPACAPNAVPTSCDKEAGVHNIVEAP